MSNVTKNLLVKGASGKMGDQFVYKTRGKKTFITTFPTPGKNTEPSEPQLMVRELFTEASAYAKGAVANPERKAAYEAKIPKGKTAFNRALRDFLKAPVVKRIDASGYTGAIGSKLVIKAKDDFRVVELRVSIHDAAGELIEEGLATMDLMNEQKWHYTTVQENASLSGCTIRAVAKDVPENTGSLELVLL